MGLTSYLTATPRIRKKLAGGLAAPTRERLRRKRPRRGCEARRGGKPALPDAKSSTRKNDWGGNQLDANLRPSVVCRAGRLAVASAFGDHGLSACPAAHGEMPYLQPQGNTDQRDAP